MFADVLGLKSMTGREGAIGQYPDALVLACTEINVIGTVTVLPGVACLEGPLRAGGAHCDPDRMAHCQGLLHRVAMMLLMLVVPLVTMRLVSMRGTVSSWASGRDRASGRGGTTLLRGLAAASDADRRRAGRHPASTTASEMAMTLALQSRREREESVDLRAKFALLATKPFDMGAASLEAAGGSLWTRRPHSSMAPSGDACGASRRWQLSAARLAPLPRPTAATAAGRGIGTPTAGRRIRCTTGLAAAHRDPILPLCSVVPLWIAMGTSYGANAEPCAVAVPAGRHNAAKRASSGRGAGGGRLSSTASATPPEVARR